jgi:hypothetical protein
VALGQILQHFCSQNRAAFEQIISMRLMPDRIWQKSTKLWQLAQYFKCKVSSKISAQLLVKFKLNARELLRKKMQKSAFCVPKIYNKT